MAKKAPVSYAAVELEPVPAPLPATPAKVQAAQQEPPQRGRVPSGRTTLKDASTQVMLYLHPAAAKALKRYAVDQNTKVHTLLIEAVEAWFKSHGLREPVRATPGED